MPIRNIIVFGAHGKVGQRLIRQFSEANESYKITAVVRNADQAKQIAKITSNSSDFKSEKLTLDEVSIQELTDAIKGNDAVIFTAGSGGKNLLEVDLDGAVKTFEAAFAANALRYVLLSAIHANSREFFENSPIKQYFIAKHYADRILVDEFSNKLDYTILRPPTLKDGPGSGKINFLSDINSPVGSIDREDVATVIRKVLNNPRTFGKSFDFTNGELDINDPSTFD
ncbi:uncharacterized protein PRCAT00006349001 [Priceomyces carsonii]|uniref:uncharacterized protein n=1 Tax=Priceomyces carsonii TaxID=28549 RepID=UPI002EDAD9A0|nr:unnamed protein product [Priceomyces carsonii]